MTTTTENEPADIAYPSLPQPDVTVVIIGAGFAGMGAGQRLLKRGIGDFLILEKADGVGGTWRHNTYPGIEVDIPSVAYSYAEAPNPDWSHTFAAGAELLSYAEECAVKFKLTNKFRFGTEVVSAEFDKATDLWTVSARDADGDFTLTTRFLISCHGALSTPAEPGIPGLDRFAGTVILSQRWNHSYSLDGRRAAVIGTGATGIQIVPAIADTVDHLTVFQRTPSYVGPKVNIRIPGLIKILLKRVPFLQAIIRMIGVTAIDIAQTFGVIRHRQFPFITTMAGRVIRASMKARVRDPELRAKLIPTYGFACKRPLSSPDYLETFNRSDVELVTDSIAEVVAEGIRTSDGRIRELDVIVLATGFKVFDLPYKVVGIDDVELSEYWRTERMRAYQGASVPGFPNLFLAPGPYGVIGFNWFDTIRLTTGLAVDVVCETILRSATRADVRTSAFEEFAHAATRAADSTVFKSPGCNGSHTYYLDQHGDTPFLRPFSISRSTRMSRQARSAYDYTRRHPDFATRIDV
ncbi:NAD(P)/FAD-dependent oxidoreductase [Gordonia sp. (in: high G+C Gram-positive bacteria)]|uniref:flavin-containing monooxygenase n=1 Tax=Gordonia sp. (in: high G+C Gram-positive bacteria) TaxID=84139 RepID=UPI0033405DC9